MHDHECKFALKVSSLTREGGRMLAIWFMRASFGRQSRAGLPYICDLCIHNSSPVVVVSQNLSAQLHGTAAALRWIWQDTGCSSMSEWRRLLPHRALALRRQIMHVSALTRRKHGSYWDDEVNQLIAVYPLPRPTRIPEKVKRPIHCGVLCADNQPRHAVYER